MLGLQDDDDALRVELFHQRVGDLARQALLHLRALREHLHQTRELRQAAHAPGGCGDVADVRLAEERHEVMLAHGVERDVAHEHHLVAMLVERGLEVDGRVLRQAGEHLLVHAGDARRGFLQALAVGVLADALEDKAHALFYFLGIHIVQSSRIQKRPTRNGAAATDGRERA